MKHIPPQDTWAQQMYSIPTCSLCFGETQLPSSVEFLLGTLSVVRRQLPLHEYQTEDEISYVITKDIGNYHNLSKLPLVILFLNYVRPFSSCKTLSKISE